eukprot:4734452-Pleurochrysis_carterae.AAC.2
MTAVYEFLQSRMARLLVPSITHGEAAQQPRQTNATVMTAVASLPPCRLAVWPLGHMAAPIPVFDHVKASSTCRPLV